MIVIAMFGYAATAGAEAVAWVASRDCTFVNKLILMLSCPCRLQFAHSSFGIRLWSCHNHLESELCCCLPTLYFCVLQWFIVESRDRVEKWQCYVVFRRFCTAVNVAFFTHLWFQFTHSWLGSKNTVKPCFAWPLALCCRVLRWFIVEFSCHPRDESYVKGVWGWSKCEDCVCAHRFVVALPASSLLLRCSIG